MDKGFVIVGKSYTNNDTYAIQKTDSLGNHDWNNGFYGDAGDYDEILKDIIELPDSSFIAVSHLYQKLWKFSSAGDTVWTKPIIGMGSGNSINITASGYIIGTTYGLVKTDTSGNVQWTKGGGQINDAHETNDGGYVGCGLKNIAGNDQIYVIKTDSAGNVFTGMEEIYDENITVSVFPNPAHGQLNVWVSEQREDLKFTLRDITGREVKAQAIVQQESPASFSLENVSPGLYIYQVTSNVKLLAAGKLIVE
jgi:hypothetical protein